MIVAGLFLIAFEALETMRTSDCKSLLQEDYEGKTPAAAYCRRTAK
jgi:hypothetical protein